MRSNRKPARRDARGRPTANPGLDPGAEPFDVTDSLRDRFFLLLGWRGFHTKARRHDVAKRAGIHVKARTQEESQRSGAAQATDPSGHRR